MCAQVGFGAWRVGKCGQRGKSLRSRVFAGVVMSLENLGWSDVLRVGVELCGIGDWTKWPGGNGLIRGHRSFCKGGV